MTSVCYIASAVLHPRVGATFVRVVNCAVHICGVVIVVCAEVCRCCEGMLTMSLCLRDTCAIEFTEVGILSVECDSE